MVERYDNWGNMERDGDGAFVMYSDYAALKAENETLREDNKVLQTEACRAWGLLKETAERALAERAGGVNEDALRALAQAYDREDAAQRGEPDPWNLDDPGDIGDSDTWVSERLACARAAAEAFLSALEPAAPDVIAKGLLSDADAKAAKLGKFGHHPDPAIDFEIEVESLQARLIDAKGGISKPGTEPEAPAAVLADIERAMTFRVGGDPSAVRAKQMLRDLEADAKQAVQPAAPEGRQEAVALTYGQKLIAEAISSHFGERGENYDEYEGDTTVDDVWNAFDALTRPSEQAVTEAMVDVAARAIANAWGETWECCCTAKRGLDCDCGDAMVEERDGYDERLSRDDCRMAARAALKAAMEAGRHD